MVHDSAFAPASRDTFGERWSSSFGREADFAEVSQLLGRPDVRLVTITGRAGVGKTHLAQRLVDSSPIEEMVPVPVPLAFVLGPGLVPAAIASQLGVTTVPSTYVLDTLANHIGDSQMLLVLDNFEHVLEAAGSLFELLERCPRLKILITSQSALGLRGEHVHSLKPLPVPDATFSGDLDELAHQPAVALYCDRASAVDNRFELTTENASAVASLCNALEGLPLALELAAARSTTLPAEAINARLADSPLDLLRRRRTDVPMRSNDLRAAIDWTYRLLTPGEQCLLRRLSVTTAPASIELAEDLNEDSQTSDTIDELSALVDFHLVDPVLVGGVAAYSLPSSIRSFAREELRNAGEENAARATYVRAMTKLAQRLHASQDTTNEAQWLEQLTQPHDNLLEAMTIAAELGMTDQSLDIARVLARLWEYRGYKKSYGALLDVILDITTGIETAARAETLAWSAYLNLREGGLTSTVLNRDRLELAGRLAKQVDPLTRLSILAATALCSPITMDFADGHLALTEGLALAEEIGHVRWTARFEAWLAAVAHQAKDDERAIALGRSALRRGRACDDLRSIVIATSVLHPLSLNHPELADELPPTPEILQLARDLGMTLFEASALSYLASESALRGDIPSAIARNIEALERLRGTTMTGLQAISLLATSHIAVARGDDELAAYVVGALDPLGDKLQALSPYEWLAMHEGLILQARMRMGERGFEAARRRGNAVPPAQMLDEALDYLRPLADVAKTAGIKESAGPLTQRQAEVLKLMARGLRNLEIAEELHVAPKTVMHHCSAIYQALGVRGRSEATAWAVRNGLVD